MCSVWHRIVGRSIINVEKLTLEMLADARTLDASSKCVVTSSSPEACRMSMLQRSAFDVSAISLCTILVSRVKYVVTGVSFFPVWVPTVVRPTVIL
jgi:hypothetical protein